MKMRPTPEKRKEMIRNVQRVISKLESKVPATPAVDQNSNPMATATTTSTDTSTGTNNEDQSRNSPNENISDPTTSTEQSIST